MFVPSSLTRGRVTKVAYRQCCRTLTVTGQLRPRVTCTLPDMSLQRSSPTSSSCEPVAAHKALDAALRANHCVDWLVLYGEYLFGAKGKKSLELDASQHARRVRARTDDFVESVITRIQTNSVGLIVEDIAHSEHSASNNDQELTALARLGRTERQVAGKKAHILQGPVFLYQNLLLEPALMVRSDALIHLEQLIVQSGSSTMPVSEEHRGLSKENEELQYHPVFVTRSKLRRKGDLLDRTNPINMNAALGILVGRAQGAGADSRMPRAFVIARDKDRQERLVWIALDYKRWPAKTQRLTAALDDALDWNERLLEDGLKWAHALKRELLQVEKHPGCLSRKEFDVPSSPCSVLFMEPRLRPNMRIESFYSKGSHAWKKQLANATGELTQLPGISVSLRDQLISEGFSDLYSTGLVERLSAIDPPVLSELITMTGFLHASPGACFRVTPDVVSQVLHKYAECDQHRVLFVDVELANPQDLILPDDLQDPAPASGLLFLIGCGFCGKDGAWHFTSFPAKTLSNQGEADITRDFLDFVSAQKPQAIVAYGDELRIFRSLFARHPGLHVSEAAAFLLRTSILDLFRKVVKPANLLVRGAFNMRLSSLFHALSENGLLDDCGVAKAFPEHLEDADADCTVQMMELALSEYEERALQSSPSSDIQGPKGMERVIQYNELDCFMTMALYKFLLRCVT
ncbi:hypothetical protein FVE85_3171 [Porphyridium purpureum]|uniref:Uncharacterized protein n=1 Tax=Porphyridium purpureum TaxID=35688 RepID=A0A5J4YVI3_PORPP|nr:hypothetical protein FVE85_3171 [Porphyridium purpureum]|eukprot:POR8087..scf227_4